MLLELQCLLQNLNLQDNKKLFYLILSFLLFIIYLFPNLAFANPIKSFNEKDTTLKYHFLVHHELDINTISLSGKIPYKKWIFSGTFRHPRYQLKRELAPLELNFNFYEFGSKAHYNIFQHKFFKLYTGGHFYGNFSDKIRKNFLEFEEGENIVGITISDELKAQGVHAVTAFLWDIEGGIDIIAELSIKPHIFQIGSTHTGGYINTEIKGGTPTIEADLLHDTPFPFYLISHYAHWQWWHFKYLAFKAKFTYKYMFYEFSKFDESATQNQKIQDNIILEAGIIFAPLKYLSFSTGFEFATNLLLGESRSLMTSYTLEKYHKKLYQIYLGVSFF